MAKLVACKACKKEIAQYARTCPHCGQKNPTVNLGVVFLVFVALVLVAYFLIFGSNGDDTTHRGTNEANKTSRIDPNNLALFGISISKREFIEDPAQVFLKLDSDNLYAIEIDKSKLKTGYSWVNNNDKWETYENWPVTISGYFNGNRYSIEPVPECKGKCYVRLAITDYDPKARKAVITLSAKLLNTSRYMHFKSQGKKQKGIEIIGFDDLSLEITNTANHTYFDNLTLIDKRQLPTTGRDGRVIGFKFKPDTKENTIKLLTAIIEGIESRKNDIQHVRKTQSMERGESGSIYLAKWNGEVQKWEKGILENYEDLLAQNASFCPQGGYNTNLAISALKLLGVAYVFGDSKQEEKQLVTALKGAKNEISACENER